MATDRRIGKQAPDHFRREASPIRLDTGPYVGKVKNNLDPTRSGRLQVWIPDLGGGEEDRTSNWRTVSYASPFFGSTTQPDTNKQNAYSKVRHTYGMWFVPPDIGNLVLCTFVAGDPDRGFWFACIPNQLGHHMVPGIAGSKSVDTDTVEDSAAKQGASGPVPVAEFNENDTGNDWANFVNLKKPVHEEQLKVLINQGLEKDFVRGIISSSSQREMPSGVFGISTPGRALNDPAPTPEYQAKLNAGTLNEKDYVISGRKGGHQFVMDDGNWQDQDRLIRLRTSGGHQILMNDSEKILYIGNSDGSVWVELTGPGHLNIYTGNSVNVRARGDLNLHADRNINMNAGQKVNISGSAGVNIQGAEINVNASGALTAFGATVGIGSGGVMNLSAGGVGSYTASGGLKFTGSTIKLNDGMGGTVSRPPSLKINTLSDTGKQGSVWVSTNGALSTIVPIAPTHEPWGLHSGTELASGISTNATSTPGSTGTTTAPATNGVTTGEPPTNSVPAVDCQNTGGKPAPGAGPAAAAGKPVKNPVKPNYLKRSDNYDPPSGIGPLTPLQTKALMTQLGWNESGFKYDIKNQYWYIGKYQFGAAALVDQGYIKLDAYKLSGNKSVSIANSWTGKDGIKSYEDWFTNGPVQEKAMHELLRRNYSTLKRIGAVSDSDDICAVAGMLAASHLIGAGGAKTWRNTSAGGDANGTTGTTYYNMGRYAVDVLAGGATTTAA